MIVHHDGMTCLDIEISVRIRTETGFDTFFKEQTDQWKQAFDDALVYAITWGIQKFNTARSIYISKTGAISVTVSSPAAERLIAGVVHSTEATRFHMEGGVDFSATSGFRFHS